MLPGVKNGARRGTFFLLRNRVPIFASRPPRRPGSRRPGSPGSLLGVATVLLFLMITACDEDVSLVDPTTFFTFNANNAWPTTCTGPAPSPAVDGDQPLPGAPPPPGVPPPPGLFINACPNPAPPGALEIVIEFRLDVRVPSVNLAIVNSRGEIIAVLMRDEIVEVDQLRRVPWLLEGVPPGTYRAYFRGGRLETSGDLVVQ